MADSAESMKNVQSETVDPEENHKEAQEAVSLETHVTNNNHVTNSEHEENNSSSVIDLVNQKDSVTNLFANKFLGAEFRETVQKSRNFSQNSENSENFISENSFEASFDQGNCSKSEETSRSAETSNPPDINLQNLQNLSKSFEIEMRIVETEETEESVKNLTTIAEVTEMTKTLLNTEVSHVDVPSLTEDSEDSEDSTEDYFEAPVPLGFVDSRNPTIERKNSTKVSVPNVVNIFGNSLSVDRGQSERFWANGEVDEDSDAEQSEDIKKSKKSENSENSDTESLGPPCYVPMTPSLEITLEKRKKSIPMIDLMNDDLMNDDDAVTKLERFHTGVHASPTAPTSGFIYGDFEENRENDEFHENLSETSLEAPLSTMKALTRTRSRRTPPPPPRPDIKNIDLGDIEEKWIDNEAELEASSDKESCIDIVPKQSEQSEKSEKSRKTQESEASDDESENLPETAAEDPEIMAYGNPSNLIPMQYGNIAVPERTISVDSNVIETIEDEIFTETPVEAPVENLLTIDRIAKQKQDERIEMRRNWSNDSTLKSTSSSVLNTAFMYHTTKKRNRPSFVKNQSVFNDPNAEEILNAPLKQQTTLKKISSEELEVGVKIGEGQFGMVNQGHYKSIEVALKFFKSSDLGTLKSIEDEANFMADMTHKNVQGGFP